MSVHDYYVYLRKSSESEERQELSIDAQRTELTTLIAKRGYRVVGKMFEESMSAKKPGRPLFGQMVDGLEKKKAQGIICWKLDRLARNPKDGGNLMWALGQGIIKEIVTPERTYTGTSDDKLLMSIIFGMATKYSDDLSDNIKRGQREALRQGRWPHSVKIGYLRDQVTKDVVPDPTRYTVVRHMWDQVLAGVPPLDVLRQARADLGLTTPRRGRSGGVLLNKARLYRMLHDPFYTGVLTNANETYAGKHQAMVTPAEFQRVQEILSGRRQAPLGAPGRLPFTYRGMIRCGACGAMVTAENTTNKYGTRYIHYHCCRKEKRYLYCPERSLEEQKLEAQVVEFLGGLALPPTWERYALKKAAELLEGAETHQEELNRSRRDRVVALDQQLEKLRDLCVREVITEADYQRDRNRLTAERGRLQQQALQNDHGPSDVELFLKQFSFAAEAKFAFLEGGSADRRALLSEVTSNLLLKDKTLLCEAKKPYLLYGSWRGFSTQCSWWNHVRTKLFEKPKDVRRT